MKRVPNQFQTHFTDVSDLLPAMYFGRHKVPVSKVSLMRFQPLQHTHLLAAVVFIAAILVLAVQLISPSPVVVSLGENGAQTTSVGEYFTFQEAILLVVGAFVSGVSGMYLVFHNQTHVLAHDTQAGSKVNERHPRVPNGGTLEPSRAERPEDDSPTDTDRWEETLERLANNQETIYELLIEADGTLPQRQLVEETDLSKATVSRTLDKLEHRGLVERKRSGMGNTIHLL